MNEADKLINSLYVMRSNHYKIHNKSPDYLYLGNDEYHILKNQMASFYHPEGDTEHCLGVQVVRVHSGTHFAIGDSGL